MREKIEEDEENELRNGEEGIKSHNSYTQIEGVGMGWYVNKEV